jgi:hypothetical protein
MMVQMSVDWMDLSRFAKPGRNSLFEQVFEEVLNGVEELDQPRERTGFPLSVHRAAHPPFTACKSPLRDV